VSIALGFPGVYREFTGVQALNRHPAAIRLSPLLAALEEQLVHSAHDVVADCPDIVERQAGGGPGGSQSM
jgi:hypothetical protein